MASDFCWDGNGRLLKSAKDAIDIANLAFVIEAESDFANFDDFIGSITKTRGFGV